MNRTTRWTTVLVTGLIGLLGLGACSTGTGPAPTPAASSAATSSTAATSASSSTSSAPTAATTTSAGAYPAADVCTYLTGQLPTLKAIGAPAGVQASLAGNLFGYFQSHGIPADGAQLDAATTAQCPDVRSQILTLAGLTTFAEL